MPRKQLDRLKDIFLAHKDKNESQYQAKLQEYIDYLRWKGFNKKADEFEKELNLKEIKSDNIENINGDLLLFNEAEPSKEHTIVKEELEKVSYKQKTTWQVARGADVNLLKAQQLLSKLIEENLESYSTEHLSQILGYSKEKTQGFTRILYFMRLIDDDSKQPTKLARIILKADPYFEDLGTIWFLHYSISSQPSLIIWNRLTNNLYQNTSFTLYDTEGLFEDQKKTHSEYSYKHHLKKEFNVCTNAYINSEFKKLNLLSTNNKDEFIRLKPVQIPDKVLLAVILLYRDKFFSNQVALEINELYKADNSPGRLTYMNEYKFREALERLRIQRLISIESFADLDQIKFNTSMNYLETLESYFESKYSN
ncbi:MAG: DUF4007 family protein [Bacteroidetes bacterium]|nr:DUF4007 family protein [Bacteroidota bacterium]